MNQNLVDNPLGFEIPRRFLEFTNANRASIQTIRCTNASEGICLTADDVVANHLAAVESSLCTHEQPPRWLGKYVAIGSDGGNGFYFIKRGGSGGVWLMDSDWWGPPKLVARTWKRFLQQMIARNPPTRNLQWWKFWV